MFAFIRNPKFPAFFSLAVAMSALIFSQLPPALDWAPEHDLRADISKKILIDNVMGIVGYVLTLDIKNKGNRNEVVSKLVLELTYPDGTKKTFPAESFSRQVANRPPINYPLTSIELNPGERWVESISFFSEISPSDEESISRFRVNIFKEIVQARQNSSNPGKLFVASPETVKGVTSFFNRNFDLQKGEYIGSIKFLGSDQETLLEKKLKFTIYEFHLSLIKSQTEDYKFGGGIYFPLPEPKQVWVKVQP